MTVITQRESLDLSKFDYIGWVSSSETNQIILNLYNGSVNPHKIDNAFLCLHRGRIVEFDVECDPYFPEVKSIEIGSIDYNDSFYKGKMIINFYSGMIILSYEGLSFYCNTINLS